ncbi:hypothetical protein KVT40_003668 [Elsinoe batatas]|uniref:CENP-V/GFA domain-containing protein n=1 Tax=Elsinoe batatas TaxID=2601811 RepID=A0A8K0PD89_9PEZI|nr:hypothetical protein KVT40_003668 [Elsinoe batatas]
MADLDYLKPTKVDLPKKTFTGSCMCKKMTYTVDLALPEQPVAQRCNCTYCTKSGQDVYKVPGEDFHLKTPCSTAEAIADDNTHGKRMGRFTIQASSPNLHRYFCDQCGNLVFTAGWFEYEGHRIDYFGFNSKTLDQPQEGLDLSKFKFDYFDGLNGNYFAKKTDGPHPGGTI